MTTTETSQTTYVVESSRDGGEWYPWDGTWIGPNGLALARDALDEARDAETEEARKFRILMRRTRVIMDSETFE